VAGHGRGNIFMPHPLEQKLARVRRRARQYVLAGAIARSLTVLVEIALALAALDALFHYRDRGLRAISSLVLLSAAAIAARRIWRAVRESRYHDVQIAQRLEQRFPTLRGRLASAVEFVREPAHDPLAGSVQLRGEVIRSAIQAVDQLDLSTALDARPARRALAGLGLLAALLLSLFFFAGPASRIAALRLLNPLSDVQWPRTHQLAILAPVERLPHGQTFEVEVVDQGAAQPPDDVVMHYRFHGADGDIVEETEPLKSVGGPMLARREGVERSFEYRAVGGDDYTMPWIALDVVEPPAVRSSSLMLHFPGYTGWPPRASEANIRALAGTKVAVNATFTKPLAEAVVQLGDDTNIPATIRADGYAGSIAPDADTPFEIRNSGAYSFLLTDRDGFHNVAATRYEVRAVPDASPTVEIVQPKANLFVTPDAALTLSVRAGDDLAVRRVTLDFLRSDKSDAGEESHDLFTGPDVVTAELAAESAAEGYAGDHRELSYQWQLAPLGLAPGTQVSFHATATDYADQAGQSLPRRLTIVTAEEVQDRLADRQAVIHNELARVLQLEQSARSHVAGLQVQLEQTGELKKTDIDTLQGASLNQQQVERELTSDHEGLRGQINDLLDELNINKIDGPDTQRPMQDLLDRLSRLAAGSLPDASRHLSAAAKAAQVEQPGSEQRSRGGRNPAQAPLAEAAQAQDEVVDALSRMLDDMKQWGSFRHFHREVGQVAKAQEELVEETAALGQQTLSRAFEDLAPQQRADLQKLAQRQLELARRLDRIEQQMDDTVGAARQEDPVAADSMADALAHARNQGVAEQMREAGRGVEQNRIGQAQQAQRRSAEELRELLDILSSRRENELGRLVKKLREAEKDLERLAAEQQGLQKKLREAEKLPDPERRQELERLSRQERKLQEEAERFSRKLERLQAEEAGAQVGKAAGQMGQSADSGAAGEAGGAAEQAEAARKDLEEAQRELAEKRKQAESDLAQEQLARIEDAIKSVQERQEKLIGETVHYQLRQSEHGHLTRAEAASVRELARVQLALRDEMQELAKTLAGAEVFQFVLESAGQDMTRAAERLERRDVADETVRIENNALARIAQLNDALANDSAEDEKDAQQEEGGEGGGEGSSKPGRSVAELKLLKSIQEQLKARTATLAESRRQSTEPTVEQETEYEQISREQGRLADLVTNMKQATDQRPEDDPANLPDIRRDDPTPAEEKATPQELP
jgi:hypothetical protein